MPCIFFCSAFYEHLQVTEKLEEVYGEQPQTQYLGSVIPILLYWYYRMFTYLFNPIPIHQFILFYFSGGFQSNLQK